MARKLDPVLIFGGAAALLLFFTSYGKQAQAAVSGVIGGALSGYGGDGQLSVVETLALAERIVSEHFPHLDPGMLVAIAEIESGRRPTAFRLEPHVGDASTGLMQTLAGTARWMFDIGATAYPRPDATDLFDPETSMYFGAAYVDYLLRYRGEAHPEEWVIRAYNGGPGGADSAATAPYWAKYAAARQRLGV